MIGAPGHAVTEFNCMDWHAPMAQIPWNQPHIKNAPQANGWWQLEIVRAGRYEFTLRQQPALARFPLPATQARLKIGELETPAVEVPAGATSVSIAVSLPAGESRLQTWLTHQTTGDSRGAFFVEVRHLE